MARNVMYSFHYALDSQRAAQVRNMGVLEGNAPVSDNDWEAVTKGGTAAIEKWIAGQIAGRTCVVVLIGKETAGRKWVTHEISSGWNAGLGVVGIYIHNLQNLAEQQTTKGLNPIGNVTLTASTAKLSTIAKAYDPPYSTSTNVYAHIKANLAGWVEEAITIRKAN